MQSREQKLVDICFELVAAATSKDNAAFFKGKSNEQKMEWTAETLRSCGFDTAPVGSSWGVLK